MHSSKLKKRCLQEIKIKVKSEIYIYIYNMCIFIVAYTPYNI